MVNKERTTNNPLLVFDLDGTLVDTAPDLTATLARILAKHGYAEVDDREARNFIGHGARAMVERALRAQNQDITDALLDDLFQAFLDDYSINICVKSQIYPSLEARLDQLKELGWRFAVCTNKKEGLSRTLLERLSLAQRFEAICGSDTFGVAKPDPQHLVRTIHHAGGHPHEAIMIGDAVTDVNASKAANIPVIGVTFGYTPVPIAELEPDHVISHFDELTVDLLNDLLNRRPGRQVTTGDRSSA